MYDKYVIDNGSVRDHDERHITRFQSERLTVIMRQKLGNPSWRSDGNCHFGLFEVVDVFLQLEVFRKQFCNVRLFCLPFSHVAFEQT